jgi:hypothetical protein
MKQYLHPHILKLISKQYGDLADKYFMCYTIPGIISSDPKDDYARIYIIINDNINNNPKLLLDLILTAKSDNSIWLTGIDGFKCGVDYFVNNSLSKIYSNGDTNLVLPDYILEGYFNNDQWFVNDLTNYDYYIKLNKILECEFSEEELNNFYITFCKIILENKEISNDILVHGNNSIYKQVLEYYANGQSNEAFLSMQLIMNSMYATNAKSGSCGCNSVFGENSINNLYSCTELYTNAMFTYLQTMLGDINFYEDWFYIYGEDESKHVNEAITEQLKKLINEFLNLGYSLVFTKSNTKNCDCPIVNIDETLCNTKIIDNYKSVLKYVEGNTIEYNRNKIKVYGNEFAKLLPNLQF